MGCLPEKKNPNQNNITGTEGSSFNNEESIIYEGILIKERNIDPHDFYEELNILGEGTYGTVKKVRHKITKVIRAMKIIDKNKISFVGENSLINEINIVKSLDHPNIMKVYEFFKKDNYLYIISELLSGGELLEKINDSGYLSEEVSSFIMKQIFSAVDFCHQKGILHRDLKPENILIESEAEAKKEFFTIKIIDFGTSGKLKDEGNDIIQDMVGTPLYVAPEILGNEKYDNKCDMWSCGVIMYMMLSGKAPFNGENEEEIYQCIKKGKYNFDSERWDEISDDAKDLINHLLTYDPNKRFSAKKALNHPWIIKYRRNIKINKEKLNEVVINFKNYSANLKLQQLTLIYIVHNLIPKKDCEFLRELFIIFDEDGSGRLTKEKLIKGLNNVLPLKEAEIEVNRLMDIIDVDGSGFIEYEEFLRAGLNKKKIITKENLEMSFNLFDINKRGKINFQELGKILGNNKKHVCQEILNEADVDKDGEINFNDFKTIMEQC